MALPQRYEKAIREIVLPDKDDYTEEEYFAFEERTPERWEFVPLPGLLSEGGRLGEIRTMGGGTADHSAIAVNLMAGLTTALRGSGAASCRVFGSDLKVHTADSLNTYPDVSVVCGPLVFHRRRRDTITNPLLIAEVLSPSTEAYDRSGKWQSYQTIPTLAHYLLIATDQPRIEIYTREESGWHFAPVAGLEALLALPALGVMLALTDLYAQVEFAAEREP